MRLVYKVLCSRSDGSLTSVVIAAGAFCMQYRPFRKTTAPRKDAPLLVFTKAKDARAFAYLEDGKVYRALAFGRRPLPVMRYIGALLKLDRLKDYRKVDHCNVDFPPATYAYRHVIPLWQLPRKGVSR